MTERSSVRVDGGGLTDRGFVAIVFGLGAVFGVVLVLGLLWMLG